MRPVIDAAIIFFGYAVVAMFAQNAVFTRALGVSRLVQLVGESADDWRFGFLLCMTQVLSAPLAYFVNERLAELPYRAMLRALAYVGCVALVCLAEHIVLRVARRRRLVLLVPVAGLNSCVLGTVLVERTQSFTMMQSLGFGFGSGLGYIMAVMLVGEAKRRLHRRSVPRAFQGLPITLIYVGVLALAIYGFTGHSVIL